MPTLTEPTYRVHHGGLMRCCLQSLDDEMAARITRGAELMIEGDTTQCVYHKPLDEPPTMVCDTKNGELAWRWNH